MTQALPARQETLGDRFDAMYANASSMRVYEGPSPEPEINSQTPATEIGDTGLYLARSLYRGSSGLLHLTTQVAMHYEGKPYRLFSFTASSGSPANLSEYQPTRVAGFRAGESEGDYALARDLGQNKPGIVVAYLGQFGLTSGTVGAERVSGNVTARESDKVDELPYDKRQLIGQVTSNICFNVAVAKMVLGGTEAPIALAMLGRQTEPAAKAV